MLPCVISQVQTTCVSIIRLWTYRYDLELSFWPWYCPFCLLNKHIGQYKGRINVSLCCELKSNQLRLTSNENTFWTICRAPYWIFTSKMGGAADKKKRSEVLFYFRLRSKGVFPPNTQWTRFTFCHVPVGKVWVKFITSPFPLSAISQDAEYEGRPLSGAQPLLHSPAFL